MDPRTSSGQGRNNDYDGSDNILYLTFFNLPRPAATATAATA